MLTVAFEFWTAKASDLDVRGSVERELIAAGFTVDEGGTTSMQVSALKDPCVVGGYWSNVRLLVMWENRNMKKIRIELRTDEPAFRPDTHCKGAARELQKLLPPL
jgi:hypothetical protein